MSCRSSGCPWLFIPEDGVEEGHELAHAGDDGDLCRLSGSSQAMISLGERGELSADRGRGCSSPARALRNDDPAAGDAWPCGRAGCSPWRLMWSDAGQRGDLGVDRDGRARASRRAGCGRSCVRYRARWIGPGPRPRARPGVPRTAMSMSWSISRAGPSGWPARDRRS